MTMMLKNTGRLETAAGNVVPFPAVTAGSLRGRQMAFDGEMSALNSTSLRVRFARNETIFSDGDAAAFAYRVVAGSVRLCKHTIDGRRQVLDFLAPGDLFGLVGREHGFTAEAVVNTTLIAYPREQFDRLGTATPSVGRRMLDLVSEDLVTMQHHIVVLGCQSAKERVASFLLRQADRMRPSRGQPLELPMGRQDLGDHLGLTIETVCRAISELRREGIIAVPNGHQVVVNNFSLLRAIVEGADAAWQ